MPSARRVVLSLPYPRRGEPQAPTKLVMSNEYDTLENRQA